MKKPSRRPAKKLYVVHPGDGSHSAGEPYALKSDAVRVAQELESDEGVPWYVATYVLSVPSKAAAEARREKVAKLCSKWFRYGEYLAVEIDTEAGTCTVLER